MLVLVSPGQDYSPEDTDCDFSFVAPGKDDVTSAWFGHPLKIGGVLRDGTQVSLGLNMSECAQIFLAMQAEQALRDWVETMQAMRAGFQLS